MSSGRRPRQAGARPCSGALALRRDRQIEPLRQRPRCRPSPRSRPSQPWPSAASHASFLPPVLTFCAAAVVAVPLFRRLGLSAVLGYLAAGVVIGPSGLALIGTRTRSRERRRARRRAAALHRRARTASCRGSGRCARTFSALGLAQMALCAAASSAAPAGRVRPLGSAARSSRHRARPVGDRDRAADARGARRPADALRPARLRGPAVPGLSIVPILAVAAAARRRPARDRRSRPARPCWRSAARLLAHRASSCWSAATGSTRSSASSPRAAPREVMTACRAARGARRRAADGGGRAVDGDGRLPRRRAARRIEFPPPARGRHRAVPRHAARPVLHERRHVDRRWRSCASNWLLLLARGAGAWSPSRSRVIAVLFRALRLALARRRCAAARCCRRRANSPSCCCRSAAALGLLPPPQAQLVTALAALTMLLGPVVAKAARRRPRAHARDGSRSPIPSRLRGGARQPRAGRSASAASARS